MIVHIDSSWTNKCSQFMYIQMAYQSGDIAKDGVRVFPKYRTTTWPPSSTTSDRLNKLNEALGLSCSYVSKILICDEHKIQVFLKPFRPWRILCCDRRIYSSVGLVNLAAQLHQLRMDIPSPSSNFLMLAEQFTRPKHFF
jgi:hypothetical protein